MPFIGLILKVPSKARNLKLSPEDTLRKLKYTQRKDQSYLLIIHIFAISPVMCVDNHVYVRASRIFSTPYYILTHSS